MVAGKGEKRNWIARLHVLIIYGFAVTAFVHVRYIRLAI
jgi:hypothetical protein